MTSNGRTLSVDDESVTIGDDGEEDTIVINVGGLRHEALVSTLLSKPNTRLCNLAKKHIRSSRVGEYFFDRHAGVFETVIDFYRTGACCRC